METLETALTLCTPDKFLESAVQLVTTHKCKDQCRVRSRSNCKFIEQTFYCSITGDHLELFLKCSELLDFKHVDWNMVDLIFNSIQINNEEIKLRLRIMLRLYGYH